MNNSFPMDAAFVFPLWQHTPVSLINLIHTIYTRGPLVSKAVNGDFFVSEQVVEQIRKHGDFGSTDEFITFIRSFGDDAVRGIQFEDGKLVYDGFCQVPDADHMNTYMKLASALNSTVLNQRRIRAMSPAVDNGSG